MTQRASESSYEEVLGRLGGVKRQAGGGAMARCPVHEDNTASVKVDEASDGRVLIYCHAKCAPERIVAAIGLTMADLFPHKNGRPLKSVKIVGTHDYNDADGTLRYQVVRVEPKGFRQRRPDGKSGWIYNLNGVVPLLYHLPKLINTSKDQWVVVCEGEKDVDNLVALGFAATCNSGGAGNFKPEFAPQFKGRRVAISPDNDDPGRAHAQMVAAIVAPVASEAKILELPGLPAKGDVSDWISAGGTREQLLELIAAAPRYEANAAKPIIIEEDDQYQVVAAQAFGALMRKNDPVHLGRFVGGLFRLEQNETGEHHIVDLDVHRLRDELTKAAQWVDGKFRPRVPSVDFARLLLAAASPPLPAVSRFVTSPVFTKDGRLLQQPGLDPSSGIYVLPHPFKLGDIPKKPSMREIESARELLDDLLHDFPFASPADKANALAIPLERIVRELVDGPLPINAIEASTRGAGKGLLARVLLAITSTPTAIWSEVKDEAEIRKALTSFFAAGTEAVLIDNLRHGLVSGVIAAAVTTDEWIDRLLGTNRLVRAKVRCSWIVTANNLSASSEILRRCSRIRLTPIVERPEERTDFRHPGLMQWVVEHRPDLLRALIIFINHWIDYGRPAPTMAPLGSFESWTKTIGGILETNGITDFQANRREFAEVADLETAPWRELIAKWWDEHTDKLVQSKDLFLLAEGIDGFPLRGKDERGLRTSFGTELRKFKDRVLAITVNKTLIEVQVVMSPEKLQGAAQWRLVKDKANAA